MVGWLAVEEEEGMSSLLGQATGQPGIAHSKAGIERQRLPSR